MNNPAATTSELGVITERLESITGERFGGLHATGTTRVNLVDQSGHDPFKYHQCELRFGEGETGDGVPVASTEIVVVDNVYPCLGDMDDFVMTCDAECGDLYSVAARLKEADDAGELDEWEGTSRIAIVNSVHVNEPFRGIGLGKFAVAGGLVAAGAVSMTLVAAVAGAREGDYAATSAAAAGVLAGAGLKAISTEYGDVFVAAGITIAFTERIMELTGQQ